MFGFINNVMEQNYMEIKINNVIFVFVNNRIKDNYIKIGINIINLIVIILITIFQKFYIRLFEPGCTVVNLY